MSELIGAIMLLLLLAIGAVLSEIFYIWARAYKKRGYCTKRQLRKIEQWVERMEKRA